MRTAEMVAIGKFAYGGDELKPGDIFWAEPEHARLLKIVGNAKDHAAPTVAKKSAPKPKQSKSKRRYNRRDMRAG